MSEPTRGAPAGSGDRGTAPPHAPAGDPTPLPPQITEDERLLESPSGAPAEALPGAPAIGEAWRIFRIMGEFVKGFEEMSALGPCVSIFGSARVTPEDPGYQLCVETARQLGRAGFGIITGGGPGMMEAANRGARRAGVPSVGCNIELPFEQASNPFLDVSITFRYFFVRKTMFVKYSEAFVIMPGGFGTLDELFEALTLVQTQKVRDFPVVLVGREYWQGLLDWLDEAVATGGKISPEDQELLLLADTPEEVVQHVLHNYGRHQERLRREAAERAAGAPPRDRIVGRELPPE